MKCPHCGNEMELGHLSAGGYRILWTPRGRHLTTWRMPREEVVESPGPLGELHNTAHICKRCQKVIVDY